MAVQFIHARGVASLTRAKRSWFVSSVRKPENERERAFGARRMRPSSRDARVVEQAAAEHDAVGNETGQRAGAVAPAGKDEHEGGVHEQAHPDADERPGPEAHLRTVAASAKSSTSVKLGETSCHRVRVR